MGHTRRATNVRCGSLRWTHQRMRAEERNHPRQCHTRPRRNRQAHHHRQPHHRQRADERSHPTHLLATQTWPQPHLAHCTQTGTWIAHGANSGYEQRKLRPGAGTPEIRPTSLGRKAQSALQAGLRPQHRRQPRTSSRPRPRVHPTHLPLLTTDASQKDGGLNHVYSSGGTQ